MPRPTLAERILARVEADTNGGCWLWNGSLNFQGQARRSGPRGRIDICDRYVAAHRASYEAFKGPIPAGLMVLHHCDVPLCVNPAHLYTGTHHDNMADVRNRRRRVQRSDAPPSSDFTGVYPAPRQPLRPWMALIRVDKRSIYLGSFATPEAASTAYQAALAVRDQFPGSDARRAIDALSELLLTARAA